MAAVEEDTRMTRCGGEAAKPCMAGQRCLTHGLWDALGDQIASFLENVTLQEVLDGIPGEKQAMRASRPPLSLDPIGQHAIEASRE
jgi:DNA-binding IscR family transcriptional regulator